MHISKLETHSHAPDNVSQFDKTLMLLVERWGQGGNLFK